MKASRLRLLALIPILTALFFFDDLLFVLLASKLEFFQAGSYIFYALLILFFLLSAALAYAVYGIMRRRPATGREGLQGAKGVIVSRHGELWQVSLHGEIWNAEGIGRLRVGAVVEVVAVQGLILTVKKINP